jgi:tellurite resistance protein TerC
VAFVSTAITPGATGLKGGRNLLPPTRRRTLPVAAENFHASAPLWAGLSVLVIAMLTLDLLVFARGRVPRLRESLLWSVGWLVAAVVFGVVTWAWQGGEAGSQYFAGYLLERSLSLDNVFVFAVILGWFAVPAAVQSKLLGWGIALALGLRLVFIVAGAALLGAFHVTFYVFGALLLYTAYKLASHQEVEIDLERNRMLRLVRRAVPMTTDYEGDRFVTRAGGRRVATPLLAVFAVIAPTDVVFAIDSIPAIFAITRESLIVFAANAFAMLGLRALYFLVVGLRDRFVYLSRGLAAILAFVGVKMLIVDLWHVPIWVSLAVIVGTLATAILLSLRVTRASPPQAPATASR